MKLAFLRKAFEELAHAVDYYNSERSGLGFEFAAEIRKALNRMKKHPDSWPLISPNIRRCIVNRFPFAVLYYRESDRLVVIAIMHMKRRPGYWENRVI